MTHPKHHRRPSCAPVLVVMSEETGSNRWLLWVCIWSTALLVVVIGGWYLIMGVTEWDGLEPTLSPLFNGLLNFWTAASIAVGVGTYAWLLHHTLVYRRTEDDPGIPPGLKPGVFPEHRDNAKAEIAMFAGPTLLVVLLMILSWVPIDQIWETPESPDREIWVVGTQWNWEFRASPAAADALPTITHNGKSAVNVTCGEQIVFHISSSGGESAVLHSFYLPDFAVKEDAVPNIWTSLWIQTDGSHANTTYEITCAEYCGFDHADMRAYVNVNPAPGGGCI